MLLLPAEVHHSSQPSNKHSSGLLSSSSSVSSSSSQGLLLPSLSMLLGQVGSTDLLVASQTRLLATASQALFQVMNPTDHCQQPSTPQPLRLLRVLRHAATAAMQSGRLSAKPWPFWLLGTPSAPLGVMWGTKLWTVTSLLLPLSGSCRLSQTPGHSVGVRWGWGWGCNLGKVLLVCLLLLLLLLEDKRHPWDLPSCLSLLPRHLPLGCLQHRPMSCICHSHLQIVCNPRNC